MTASTATARGIFSLPSGCLFFQFRHLEQKGFCPPLHLVHLHFGLSERERRWQAAQLLEHPEFVGTAHLPTLIAGDFNDWRNTLGKRCLLAHGFQQATAPVRRFRTFPAFLPLAAIDKIYYRGPLHVEAARVVRNRPARRASDHLPVVCDFRLLPSVNGPV